MFAFLTNNIHFPTILWLITFFIFFIWSFHHLKIDEKTKIIKIINGKWKSNMYDNENGNFLIQIFKSETRVLDATIDINYSETSKIYKYKNIHIKCHCFYIDGIYRLRQTKFDTEQYYSLQIKESNERILNNTNGYLTSFLPYDFCNLTVEKFESVDEGNDITKKEN
tara:strand:+ start:1313 stop:1813 length:501 start_codon:yes stop_codon:yes gene_type:complete